MSLLTDRAPMQRDITASADITTYSAGDVLGVTGLTYRRLDHWSREAVVIDPALESAGSGTPREWSFDTVVLFSVAATLAEATGAGLDELRSACATAAFAEPDLDGVLLSVDGRWTLTDDDGVRRALTTGRAIIALDVTAVRERVAQALGRTSAPAPVVVAHAG